MMVVLLFEVGGTRELLCLFELLQGKTDFFGGINGHRIEVL